MNNKKRMSRARLLVLEKKAIKKATELKKIVDKIYKEDELFGETVVGRINDIRL
jgi:hypothetical protein